MDRGGVIKAFFFYMYNFLSNPAPPPHHTSAQVSAPPDPDSHGFLISASVAPCSEWESACFIFWDVFLSVWTRLFSRRPSACQIALDAPAVVAGATEPGERI